MSDEMKSGMNFDPITGERLHPEEPQEPVTQASIDSAVEQLAQTVAAKAPENAPATPYFDHINEEPVRKTEDKWADVYEQEETKNKKQKKQKQPKEKKQGGFFKKAFAAVLLAAIFGGVAGGTFYGICKYTGVLDRTVTVETPVADVPEVQTPIKQIDLTQGQGQQEVKIANGDNVTLVTTDLSDMVQEVVPAMVTIVNTGDVEYDFWGRAYTPQSGGTGVIIGENDTELLIVTNHHVAADSKQLDITFIDDTTVQARVKGMDSDMDLAVLSVALKDISEETKGKIAIAKIGDSSSLKLGQPAVVIGNALGYGISVTDGVISALNREMTTEDGNTGTFIQTDAAINHGNSGGALVNIKGELIGIVSSKIAGSSVEGMGYAIPISDASPIIKELMTYQLRTELVPLEEQGYLGVELQTITAEASQYYGIPEGGSVMTVVEGSGAEAAGIRKRDVITKIEKQKITSSTDARQILQYYRQGEEVTVTFSRLEDGEYVSHEVKVVLGASSSK